MEIYTHKTCYSDHTTKLYLAKEVNLMEKLESKVKIKPTKTNVN